MRMNTALKVKILESFNSQADLALQVGISESRLSRLIWRRSKPSDEEVSKICQTLQCSSADLGFLHYTEQK